MPVIVCNSCDDCCTIVKIVMVKCLIIVLNVVCGDVVLKMHTR